MAYRLLDLFCGEGGASLGYHQAGFEVVGMDRYPQKNYPFEFIKGDVFNMNPALLSEFDAIHASPPCQAHSSLKVLWIYDHVDGIPATLQLLQGFEGPWVIENVSGSNMPHSVILCGAALGCHINEPARLVLKRHRLFASNILLNSPSCHCRQFKEAGYMVLPIHGGVKNNPRMPSYQWDNTANRRRLMGIPHASATNLSQCIPPAYTRHVGQQLIDHLREGS